MATVIGYRLPSGEEIPLEEAIREGLVDEDGCPFDDATDVLTDEAPGGLMRPLVNEVGAVLQITDRRDGLAELTRLFRPTSDLKLFDIPVLLDPTMPTDEIHVERLPPDA